MTRLRASASVTVREIAAIVSQMEGRACSYARVRSLLVLGQGGRRTVVPRERGDTRLFTAYDVAIVRAAEQLKRQGVSSAVTRVILATLRQELEAAWRQYRPAALAIIGVRGWLPHEEASRDGAIAWVPLRPVWAGIEDAIAETREQAPTVVRYRQERTPRELRIER